MNDFAIETDAEFNAGSYDYTVSGNWINKGDFNGQTSTVTFTSTSLENEIAGSGESSFNNIVFGIGSSLTISTTLGVTGNLTNNGTNIDLSNASVEFTGTGNSTIGGTTSSVFDELVVNKTAATVQLSNALSVNSFISLDNGVLDLNANTITVINPDTLAINRSSGYILSENTSNSSRVDWAIGTFSGPHTFPFGNSAGDYIPLTIDLTAGDAGTVSVATYATGNDNLPLPATVTDVDSRGVDNSANTIDRFFQIDLTGETSPVVDVTFTASASEVGSITSLQAQRWNGTTWDEPLPGQSATANSVTVPGVTQFSPWTMSGNGEPLPVELLSFNASSVVGEVELNWATSTEINNDYFEVQHSANGIDFITIGKLAGAGNSNSRVDYYFVHRNPAAGRNYYRLNQVDFDYQSEISQTIMVESELLKTEISVYPNPTPDFVYITTTRDLDYIDYELYDARGMKVPMRERARQLSQQKAELNLQSLVSGSYILTIREGEHVSYHRLIKQ
ncbi:MAG: T9SS type A sorting domain-containing protein [Fulvivirga sp.]